MCFTQPFEIEIVVWRTAWYPSPSEHRELARSSSPAASILSSCPLGCDRSPAMPAPLYVMSEPWPHLWRTMWLRALGHICGCTMWLRCGFVCIPSGNTDNRRGLVAEVETGQGWRQAEKRSKTLIGAPCVAVVCMRSIGACARARVHNLVGGGWWWAVRYPVSFRCVNPADSKTGIRIVQQFRPTRRS